ncbi:hypothetical protein DY000_02025092 [Brassica cretica]|uniref:Uncharacterized protein n=1 Tax=Brassica cretica TaxID=69181 RepID=A0ABQ7EEQ9_BRACR|nr:hypothetical protein DY000_02025092 [Brassica cretica]
MATSLSVARFEVESLRLSLFVDLIDEESFLSLALSLSLSLSWRLSLSLSRWVSWSCDNGDLSQSGSRRRRCVSLKMDGSSEWEERWARYSYGCAVPSKTSKYYGEENHGWCYLCKPYGRNTPAAVFRPRLALELGTVVFYCLHALLTTSHTIFVSKTMMHVVKILRLVVAVSTFRIALLLAAVAICFVVSINGRNRNNTVSYLLSRSNYLARLKFGLGPDGKLNFPSHQHETHAFRSQYAISTGNPLWGLGDPNKAPAYDQLPHSTSFFSEKSGSGVSLCGKLPLLHQWHKLRPHPSELIAELYSSNGHDRYEAIAEIFANQ